MKSSKRTILLAFVFLAIALGGGLSAETSYFSLGKTEFSAGETIAIRFATPMKSPESSQCWMTIVAPEADEPEYGDYIYVADGATSAEMAAPKKAGSYELRLHSDYPSKQYHLLQRLGITVARPEPAASGGLEFKGIYARYSNSLSNWNIDFGEGTGQMWTRYSNSIGAWELEIPSGSAGIRARYSNSYADWTYSGNGGDIRIKTVYSNSVSPWRVEDASGRVLNVGVVFSNSLAKWDISGIGEGMSVYATYSNSLTKWTIEDRIPDADPDMKMAAVFACLISTMIE